MYNFSKRSIHQYSTEGKGVESLFSRGGTTLDVDRFKGLEDFELISFLVIK